MLKINPSKEAIEFHFKKVSEIFNKISNRKRTIKGIKYVLCKTVIDFINNEREKLISGKPGVLIDIVIDKYDKLNLNDSEKKATKEIFKYVYEEYFQKLNGLQFLNLLNIDTCVYCNRNYTTQISKDRARAELDHWFPKSDYPILALSFYNLIPSCHSCNHLKHNKTPPKGWENALNNLNHPYLDKYDFSFSYKLNSYNTPKTIVKSNDIKTSTTLEFNKIIGIYETQSSKELKDLLDLRYKYSKNYLDILCNKTFEGLNLSQEEAYRMIFGIEIEEENFHKRPFSKFKNDIIEELR